MRPQTASRFWVVLGAIAGLGIAFFVWCALSQTEPMWRGRPASFYVGRLCNSQSEETLQPFLEMGRQGLHVLQKTLRRKDPWFSPIGTIPKRVLPKSCWRWLPGEISHAKERQAAAWALAQMGILASPALPALTAALRDSDPDVRLWAARAIVELGPLAKSATPSLIILLKDSNCNVRGTAAWALGQVQAESKLAVPALIPLLKDGDVCASAALALAEYGPAASNAVPALLKLLGEGQNGAPVLSWTKPPWASGETAQETAQRVESDRWSAAQALGRMRSKPEVVVPALTEILNRSEPSLSIYVAEAIGSFGSNAAVAVPELRCFLSNRLERWVPDQALLAAISALGAIGPEARAALPELRRCLTMAHDPGDRVWVAKTIWRLAPEEVATLFPVLADPQNVLPVAEVLSQIGSPARTVLPHLKEIMRSSPNARARAYAAEAIWSLTTETNDVLPVLRELIQDESNRFGFIAARVLWHIVPGSPEAIAHELRELHAQDANLRSRACQELAKFGPAAAAAVPALMAALTDKNSSVRCYAAKALEAISPSDYAKLTAPSGS